MTAPEKRAAAPGRVQICPGSMSSHFEHSSRRQKDSGMKIMLIAITLFLFAIPAHAQARFAGGGTAAQQSSTTGTGGGSGFGGSGFGSSGFGTSLLSISATSRASGHYTYVYARGSGATYVPTRFVSFATALKMAKAESASRPKGIAEVAAEYRAEKKISNSCGAPRNCARGDSSPGSDVLQPVSCLNISPNILFKRGPNP